MNWQQIEDQFGKEISDSLYKSKIRRDVIRLLKYNYPLTVYSCSLKLRASYANTKGAIQGYGRGYPREYSLVHLGILIEEKRNTTTIYRLSKNGLQLAELLEEAGYDRNVQSC